MDAADDGDDYDEDDEDEDEDEEGQDASTSRKSPLRGGSGRTRGDRTWASQGGFIWKASGFPMVLLPAYSLQESKSNFS